MFKMCIMFMYKYYRHIWYLDAVLIETIYSKHVSHFHCFSGSLSLLAISELFSFGNWMDKLVKILSQSFPVAPNT